MGDYVFRKHTQFMFHLVHIHINFIKLEITHERELKEYKIGIYLVHPFCTQQLNKSRINECDFCFNYGPGKDYLFYFPDFSLGR